MYFPDRTNLQHTNTMGWPNSNLRICHRPENQKLKNITNKKKKKKIIIMKLTLLLSCQNPTEYNITYMYIDTIHPRNFFFSYSVRCLNALSRLRCFINAPSLEFFVWFQVNFIPWRGDTHTASEPQNILKLMAERRGVGTRQIKKQNAKLTSNSEKQNKSDATRKPPAHAYHHEKKKNKKKNESTSELVSPPILGTLGFVFFYYYFQKSEKVCLFFFFEQREQKKKKKKKTAIIIVPEQLFLLAVCVCVCVCLCITVCGCVCCCWDLGVFFRG